MNVQNGLSLLELTVVIAILGITALVVIPNFSSTDPHRLELAAQELADAMRFARSEAIRRGEPVGFRLNIGNRRMRLFRADTGSSPWGQIYDIYHPISKKPYDFYLDDHPFVTVEDINRTKAFRGTCDTGRNVYFDSRGTPRCADPEDVGIEEYDVIFTQGAHTRVVSLNGITGQVTLQ